MRLPVRLTGLNCGPEIRCDGELVSKEELRQLAEGGILQRDGRLILIDDMSAQVLAMLSAIVTPEKRGKKDHQQIARIPRLQMLDWLQMRGHGVSVRLDPREAKVLDSLLNFETIPRRSLPSGLIATLRPYQHDGYQWLAFLYEHRFGACLADDMGLGKTVQGISLLAGIADNTISNACAPDIPHLIVVPPSLLFNWESEITRFFPAASLLIYSGPERSCGDFNRFDIILTSYGIVQRDIEKLAALRFNIIIFDEAQMVKNLQAATTSAARRLAGTFKLAADRNSGGESHRRILFHNGPLPARPSGNPGAVQKHNRQAWPEWCRYSATPHAPLRASPQQATDRR